MSLSRRANCRLYQTFRLGALLGLLSSLVAPNARALLRMAAVSSPSTAGSEDDDACQIAEIGSPYVPVDSWIYPAVLRLHSLGYLDTVFIGMRPWTQASLDRMLTEVHQRMDGGDSGPSYEEAKSIYDAVAYAIHDQSGEDCGAQNGRPQLESIYSFLQAIGGTPLNDSFHFGSTVVNDFGRPFRNGVNNYSGASGYIYAGRFGLYVRGEFQGAPSAAGYLPVLAGDLATIDGTTYFLNTTTPIPYSAQTTIPAGPLSSLARGRLVEAYVSAHILNNEVSFGKQDDWLGPGVGGGMAISDNAENLYSFRINRVEPLVIPFLSRALGPFRYEFVVGPMKGHVYPRDPWVHLEQVSFKPSENLELGFERTVIWGGKDHEPVTLHTFLRSFFSTINVTPAIKNSPQDPGARFGAFYFSYRLPYLRHWLTLYADSEAHDDVSPISAPRRAAIRPGLYLSHVPKIPKLDVRVEAVSTDPPTSRSIGGQFNYYEDIQRQGFTNNGQILGDWIGREAKGGQAWIAYHFSGNEWAQVSVRNQKTPKDFIPGGTTLNDISIQVVKRLNKGLEIDGNFTYERWKAPIYMSGPQNVTNTSIRVVWYPRHRFIF
jgi:Capsule assembly protein Wzi